jgi:plastocyanin
MVAEFDTNSGLISSAQNGSVELTANKTGAFEYYCSVQNYRQMGMVGNLIVG